MVKIKIDNETKKDKFKRIASLRTRKILDSIRLLGNCSNASTYDYSEEDVKMIFIAIEKDLKRIRSLFTKTKREKFTL